MGFVFQYDAFVTSVIVEISYICTGFISDSNKKLAANKGQRLKA